MGQDIPAAPPEAEVIRLAREATGMTAQSAAEASRAHDGKGVSAAYWRDVERGYGGRRGERVTTRASARALAAMARVVGVQPAQLTAAGREDGARVLEEIHRRQRPAPPPLEPVRKENLTSLLHDQDLERLAPYLEEVDRQIAEFRPWEDEYEADTWRKPGVPIDDRRVLIALYRRHRDEQATGSGRSRTGLIAPRVIHPGNRVVSMR